MWKLKDCPRCGGDVFLDSEEHVWYEQCLQCGYRHELRTIAEFDEPPVPVAVRSQRHTGRRRQS